MWVPVRLWGKVILCLVIIDVLLFRVGWLWRVKPNFGRDTIGMDWQLLYRMAEAIETRSVRSPALVVGSSVVFRGVNELVVADALAKRHVPVEMQRLPALGADCTDSALIAWNGMRLHPWLVIYGAASRDFDPRRVQGDPIVRTFYDSSVELSALPRTGAEAELDAIVKRYWKLYRYRFFARTALATLLDESLESSASADDGGRVPSESSDPLSPEANERFGVYEMTAASYRIWERWYQSRQVSDYLAWIQSRSGEVLAMYEGQRLQSSGPEGNRHVRSFEWMLDFLRRAQVRTVIVFFPENPIFREPEAQRYFDPALSEAYAGLFARQAVAHNARFVDLRDLLPPEDFYDLIHVNLAGMRKVSARIAEIIGEEWQARRTLSETDQGQAAQ